MALSLNCFLVGDDLDRTFTVEIKKTKNVNILKDLIKEKKAPTLNHIAASDLDLWAAGFEVDALTEESLNNALDKRKLSTTTKLSSFFNNVANDDFLHIIVKAPGTS